MSMNGVYRQVSPRALSLLEEQPELAGAALNWENTPPVDSDDPLAGLPASTRAIFSSLPPEAQRMAAAQHAEMMSRMLRENPALAGMMHGEDEEFEALRAAGITDADLPDAVDILQTFHGLHFLLAGTPWEAGPGAAQAVFGGREIGEEVVYGPARVMSVAETAEVAAA